MDKKTLYKIDSKGRQREWNIWVEERENYSKIVVDAGLLRGNLVRNEVVIGEGKNLGKANATTHYTQAVAEATSTYEGKLRQGYVTVLEDAKQSTLGSGMPAPMLAEKYHPTGLQKGSKTLEKMKLKGQKVHVQPKLDGNRCLIKLEWTASGAKGGMYTRKGDYMPVDMLHILLPLIDNYIALGEKDMIILDGELFSNEMSFNELNGHLKRKNNQDLEALKKIKYHLYDIYSTESYEKRYERIKKYAEDVEDVELIPSYEIEATDENLKTYFETFIEEGHEGLMIRKLGVPYEHKRSWSLIKYKDFQDSEYELLDIKQDIMGRLGKFIMKMDREAYDRDGKPITEFSAGTTKITHEEGRQILANKDQYIGKKCTIEYFGLSEFGVPRFGKWKGVREDI